MNIQSLSFFAFFLFLFPDWEEVWFASFFFFCYSSRIPSTESSVDPGGGHIEVLPFTPSQRADTIWPCVLGSLIDSFTPEYMQL